MWSPVPWRDVSITDGFWAEMQRRNRERTLPAEYRQCRDTGRLDALRLRWQPGQQPRPHFFWDSDVAKWVEAASYSLATHPDAELEAHVEEVVGLLVAAQQPDGYLNSYFTVVEPEARFTDTRDAHELYCAGHLLEAAVAHFQATGRRSLLDALCRYADLIGTVFGRGPGQKPGYPGHEEIELALVRLWRTTGERRHLDLARYFIDERGRQPLWWEVEEQARGGTPGHFGGLTKTMRDLPRTNQSHAPVREQYEAVGHSVRAMYLYCGMADVAQATGDGPLWAACERLWDDVTERHMYVTGGIGSTASYEGFTADYDLPNASAYAETCAAVGLAFFAHRMLQRDCDGRYADVLERVLFNGVLSGVSADGETFFYVNPLASDGTRHRQDWFSCACCPPNVARLLASLGGYVWSVRGEEEAALHLPVTGSARVRLGGRDVTLEQRTDQPWGGAVAVRVRLGAPARFALRLRVPGWCDGARLRCNGEPVAAPTERGYLRLDREWRDGDEVALELAMPVQRVYAHPEVQDDQGRVALQRGPLVYCFEQVDQPDAPLARALLLPESAAPAWAAFDPALLGGVVAVTVAGAVEEAETTAGTGHGSPLYRRARPARRPVVLRAVPYFAWDNRAPGAMRVWLREA